ncbi:class I SAM-dependent methyltransferase [soil metagenome]
MADLFTSADSYDRFMGRFSVPLATLFVDLIAPADGASALDVGCGPGAVTGVLVHRLGADRVRAVDPSEQFVLAARSRFPDVQISVASADALPFSAATFDVTVAQLVVHFMPNPVAGIAEMARVTTGGGLVAANVWDFEGGRGPLGVFERASLDLDPAAATERFAPGAAASELESIFARAGLIDLWSGELTVSVEFSTFDEWWEPFTLGVGPAGAHVASLSATERRRLAEHARELIGMVPFTIDATAWTVVGRTPA